MSKESVTPETTEPGDPRRWNRASALGFGALLVAAAVLRLGHFWAIGTHDPFYEIPSVDGQLYDAWAKKLLEGDPLSDGVLFLGPLYAYFMAGVYAVFGSSPATVKGVQVVLGTASVALVGLVARETFDRRAALVATGCAAFYAMLIFYGGTLMVVNLQVPLVLAALWLALRALRDPTAWRWFACGLVLSLSALARQTTLLFSAGLGVWLCLELGRRLPWERVAGYAAAFAAGVFLLILPFTWQNYQASGEFLLLNSTSGPNLYMGNNARSDGTWVRPSIAARVDNPIAMRDAFRAAAEREAGRPLSASEVSRFWSDQAWGFIREDPGRWLRLEARKLLLFWNAREVWNNRSIEISRDFSWVLRLPLLSYAWILPFAVVGLGVTWRQARTLVPLYGLLATYLSTALIFFVLSRYRMPALPVLMVFAGAGAVALYDGLRAQEWRRLALPALGAVTALAIALLPMGKDSLHMAHYNLGNKYADLDRTDEAIASFERSIALRPRFISSHNNLAIAYEKQERNEDAIAAWNRVLELSVEQRDRRRYVRAVRHLTLLGAPPPPPQAP
ncbi:MAG: glycosyltransferase family 39 protein [Myxococcota bacterium]